MPIHDYLDCIKKGLNKGGPKQSIEIKLETKLLKQISIEDKCVEIFGFPEKEDANADYHAIIKNVANEIFSEQSGGLAELWTSRAEMVFEGVLAALISRIDDTSDEKDTPPVSYFELLKTYIELPYLKLEQDIHTYAERYIKEDVASLESNVFEDENQLTLISEQLEKLHNMVKSEGDKLESNDPKDEDKQPITWQLDHLVLPELIRAFSRAIKFEFDEVINGTCNQVEGNIPRGDVKAVIAPIKKVERMRLKRLKYEKEHKRDNEHARKGPVSLSVSISLCLN